MISVLLESGCLLWEVEFLCFAKGVEPSFTVLSLLKFSLVEFTGLTSFLFGVGKSTLDCSLGSNMW